MSPTRVERRDVPVPRIDRGPNIDFCRKHGLDEHSHLMDWFNALMLLTPNDNKEDPRKANVNGDRATKFSMANWALYSNTKASLANAGEEAFIFADKCKPFTAADINKMIGVYILYGLSPSPQIQ